MGEEDVMSEDVARIEVEQELHRFISSEVIRRKANVTVEVPLVHSGLVDSLGLVQIIAHIEKAYGVDLTASGGPADFRCIASLAAAVARLRRTPNTAILAGDRVAG
jgi:acyl carrier protein